MIIMIIIPLLISRLIIRLSNLNNSQNEYYLHGQREPDFAQLGRGHTLHLGPTRITTNKDDYDSNELEEPSKKTNDYRKQLEELLEEPRRASSQNLFVAVSVALSTVSCSRSSSGCVKRARQRAPPAKRTPASQGSFGRHHLSKATCLARNRLSYARLQCQ